MDEIALHIEFLLHTNDCVIVPGLGGFVVNISEVERNGLWGVDAPRCELVFNNKLTYNDGLLAESLMKTKTISFENAIKIIDSACNELKEKLKKGEQVIWTNLGTFKGLNLETENNRVAFSPNKLFIRPKYYGLTNVRLNPVALFTTKNKKDNSIPLKSFIQYISSAVAIALLFFFIVVSYNNFEPQHQQAEMVSKSLIFNKNNFVASAKKESVIIDATKEISKSEEANKIDSPSPSTKAATSKSKSLSSYYIIVGVYEVRDVAEKTLQNLKKQGFENASFIRRFGRLDVYSASFTDKQEAQTFLKKFKSENPTYNDAWLLKY